MCLDPCILYIYPLVYKFNPALHNKNIEKVGPYTLMEASDQRENNSREDRSFQKKKATLVIIYQKKDNRG